MSPAAEAAFSEMPQVGISVIAPRISSGMTEKMQRNVAAAIRTEALFRKVRYSFASESVSFLTVVSSPDRNSSLSISSLSR